MKKVILFLFFGLFSLTMLVAERPSIIAAPPPTYTNYVHIIVVFKFGTSTSYIEQLRISLHADFLDVTQPTNAYLWNVPMKMTDGTFNTGILPTRVDFSFGKPSEAVGVIGNQAEVQSVGTSPNSSVGEAPATDGVFDINKPFFANGSFSGVSNSRLRSGKIAILDCGAPPAVSDIFLRRHVDMNLAQTMIPNTDKFDGHGHGTGVASIIARFIDKIDPLFAAIVPIKVLNSSGQGEIWYTIKGIDAATNMNVNFINLSLISFNKAGEHSNETPLQTAIDKARNKGILVIVAAGNHGQNLDTYPASVQLQNRDIWEPANLPNDNIICVGATPKCIKKRAWFSNWGKTSVDIFAPGEDIYVMRLNNKGKYDSGTSFAAPFVSGRAIMYYLTSLSPPTYMLTRSNILGTAIQNPNPNQNLKDSCVTNGVLNVFAHCPASASMLISTTNTNSNNTFIIYPNPSSGISTIGFNVEREQTVSLNVYDLQGRLVQTILPQTILPRGAHQFSLESPVLLRGGVYFCHLKTEDDLKIQKLIIRE